MAVNNNKLNADDVDCHIIGASIGAIVYFPVWRYGIMTQYLENHRTVIESTSKLSIALKPPIRGVFATWLGMTWSRAAIFQGSEMGYKKMNSLGFHPVISSIFPTIFVGSMVQFLNAPLMVSTITIQNPLIEANSVIEIIDKMYHTSGLRGLFHSSFGGVIKSVPKYTLAIGINNYFNENETKYINRINNQFNLVSTSDQETTSNHNYIHISYYFIKACIASITSAILTNPLDNILIEKFSSGLPLGSVMKNMISSNGGIVSALSRGMTSSVVNVSIPMATTIFISDIMRMWKYDINNTN